MNFKKIITENKQSDKKSKIRKQTIELIKKHKSIYKKLENA